MAVLARQQREVAQGIIIRDNGPLLGQEYFCIYDQVGQLWKWWISYDLVPDWGLTSPKPFDQEVKPYIVPWWLKLGDSAGDIWYLYPDIDGAPLIEVAAPATGEGIGNSPALRVMNGKTRYRYAIVGGDLDVVFA